jgi:hypothetical protein
MSESYIQLPADSTGKKVRTRQRTVGANTVEEQYFIEQSERVASFKGLATTFRTLGTGATPQNLFSIENAAGSTVLVAVRRTSVQLDSTGTLIAVATQVKTSRPSVFPSGGTPLSKVAFDSTQTSSANVICRGATASDGGGASAITATAGTAGWHQFVMRVATQVGQILIDDEPMVPMLCADDPIILRANEALLVQLVQATGTNNKSTDHYIVNCMWEEFTLP